MIKIDVETKMDIDECWQNLPNDIAYHVFTFLPLHLRLELKVKPQRLCMSIYETVIAKVIKPLEKHNDKNYSRTIMKKTTPTNKTLGFSIVVKFYTNNNEPLEKLGISFIEVHSLHNNSWYAGNQVVSWFDDRKHIYMDAYFRPGRLTFNEL